MDVNAHYSVRRSNDSDDPVIADCREYDDNVSLAFLDSLCRLLLLVSLCILAIRPEREGGREKTCKHAELWTYATRDS